MENGADIFCDNILAGLNSLDKLVAAPEAEQLFDVKTNAEVKERYHELRRLRRSLDEYSSKVGALTYISFMGHFSAGKSSTINTLLGLTDEHKRLTGLHPTDKAVTLITHSSNSASLIAMHRRGDLEVGTSLIDNDMLTDSVIADTPGSGDPLILEEMVRDFLPICDCIIYFFSATDSLDSADLPILRKAHHDLPFIPMRFVVTRADEFRIDRNMPLSTTNFDARSAEQFVGELISRLAASIPGKSVSQDDIILIDNFSGFNTERLASFVSQSTAEARSNKLHSHKIAYFLKNSKELKSFFEHYLSDKIRAIHDLVSTARNNHHHFQETIRITNSRLTESWQTQRQRIAMQHNGLVEWTDNLPPFSNLPTDLREAKTVIAEISALHKNIQTHAEQGSDTICRSLKSKLSKLLSDHIYSICHQISVGPTPEKVAVSPPSFGTIGELLPDDCFLTMPISVASAAEGVTRLLAKDIHKKTNSLSQQSDALIDAIKLRTIYNEVNLVVQESVTQLSDMLDDFYRSVQLYKSGVLAVNARQLAQRVGIESAIDELERVEFTDERRSAWKNLTTESIFSRFFSSKVQLETNFGQQFERLSALRIKLIRHADGQSLETELRSQPSQTSWPGLHNSNGLAEVSQNIADGFQKAVTTLFLELEESRNSIVADWNFQLAERIRARRKSRTHRLAGFAIVGSVIGLVGYLFHAYSSTNVDSTLPVATSLGIMVNLMTTAFFWGIGLATDKTNNYVSEIKEETTKSIRQILFELIHGRKLDDWSIVDRERSRFKSILEKHWEDLITEYVYKSATILEPAYTRLVEYAETFEKECQSYRMVYELLLNSVTESYADIEKNLAVLNNVSDEIKEEAILPSFKLLDERETQLGEQMKRLVGIEFA